MDRAKRLNIPTSGVREEQAGLSLLFTTFCIIDLFGVFPIIALPRPVADCGWIGLPLAFFVFGLQIYTALMLGKCWTIAEYLNPDIISKKRYPYTAITEMALGEKSGQVVTCFLDITIFSAGIPNLIIASQNMQIIGLKLTEYHFDFSVCYWLLILGVILCPIMWLGSPKDMKWLAAISVLTVISVSALTWVCVLLDDKPTIRQIPQPTWEAVAIAYGIIAFQFDIHPTILSVQMDMEHKSKLGFPIIAGFLITGSLFAVTAFIASRKYGNHIYFNILQGLPENGALYFNLFLVTTQIFLSMVIGTSALFQNIEDKLRIPKEFNIKRCFLRSGLVVLIIFLGESVPRFDLIMGLIGGLLTGPFMFILPPILYAKFRSMLYYEKIKDKLRQLQVIKRCNIIQKETIRRKEPFHEVAMYELEKQYSWNSADPNLRINYSTFRGDLDLLLDRKIESIDKLLDLESDSDEMLLKNEVRQSVWLLQNENTRKRTQIKLTEYSAKLLSFDECLKGDPFSWLEKIIGFTVIILGIVATLAATYFSVKNTILYAQLTPSCLMNFTAASRLSSV